MKSIATILTLFVFITGLSAQGTFSNKLSTVLEKVIQDHLNNYRDIKGSLIVQHQQTTEYKSTVFVPGASSCVVTHSRESGNDWYGWSCVLLETADFNLAKNRFNDAFEQIRNSIIKLQGEKPFILNAKYEKPKEQKAINKIIFDLLPSVGAIRKLKVDLTLQKESNGWKLFLSVHDQDQI